MMVRHIRYGMLFLLIGLIGSSGFQVVAQNQPTPTLTPEASEHISEVAWSPDGSQIASIMNKDVEIRDATNGQVIEILHGHTDKVISVAWSPDGTTLASGGYDQTVKIWTIDDGQLLKTLIGHNEPVIYVLWTGKEKVLSWGIDSKTNLFAWGTQTGTLISKGIGGSVTAADISPNTNYIALSVSLILYILDANTFQVIQSSPRDECCTNQMNIINWRPDGNQVVTGSLNGLITIWDVETLKIAQQFQANPHYQPDSRDVPNLVLSSVQDTVFSKDGKLVLGISGDGTVKIWNASTGEIITEARLDSSVYAASFSPDGSRIAYSSDGTDIQIVSLADLFTSPAAAPS